MTIVSLDKTKKDINILDDMVVSKLTISLIETERRYANLKTTPTGGEINPTVSIEFVLREAASLSFLAYNKKLNNA